MVAKARKAIKLPKVKGVWRVEDRFGDWDTVQSRFFGAGVRHLLRLHSLLSNCSVFEPKLDHAAQTA